MTERSNQWNRLGHIGIGIEAGRIFALHLGSANSERFESRSFDEIEHVRTFVFANDVAEDSTEIADVLAEGLGQLTALSGRCDEGG